MTAFTADEMRALVKRVQARYTQIEHAAWNGHTYNRGEMEMWSQAAQEVAPHEWAEMVRGLAQGWHYCGVEGC